MTCSNSNAHLSAIIYFHIPDIILDRIQNGRQSTIIYLNKPEMGVTSAR